MFEMLQQRNLTRSFISSSSFSKDLPVTHFHIFLSSPCGDPVPCVHGAPAVHFICSSPRPGSRHRDGTNATHIATVVPSSSSACTFFFSARSSNQRPQGLGAGAYLMICLEQNWLVSIVAGSKGVWRKLSMAQGPLCVPWFISSIQSWSGKTQAWLDVFVHCSLFGVWGILAEV